MSRGAKVALALGILSGGLVALSATLMYRVIDQAFTIDHMTIGYRQTEKELTLMMALMEKAYAGMPKDKMLSELKAAMPDEPLKDQGTEVFFGGRIFIFDDSGRFQHVFRNQ